MYFSELVQIMFERFPPPRTLPFEELGFFAFSECITPLERMIHTRKHYKSPFLDIIKTLEEKVKLDERDLLCQAFDDDNVDITKHYIKQLKIDLGENLGIHKSRKSPYKTGEEVEVILHLEFFIQTAIIIHSAAMVKMLLELGECATEIARSPSMVSNILLRKDFIPHETIQVAELLLRTEYTNTVDSMGRTLLHNAVQES